MRGTTTAAAGSPAEVATANTGQRNHQLICSVACVLLAAKERADSAPDMMWVCAWCLVSAKYRAKVNL